ncbi:MAG: hypothetical protein ACREA9_01300 [Pyrinomonadaceae bacterium]
MPKLTQAGGTMKRLQLAAARAYISCRAEPRAGSDRVKTQPQKQLDLVPH